jgi:hypothetical protein
LQGISLDTSKGQSVNLYLEAARGFLFLYVPACLTEESVNDEEEAADYKLESISL